MTCNHFSSLIKVKYAIVDEEYLKRIYMFDKNQILFWLVITRRKTLHAKIFSISDFITWGIRTILLGLSTSTVLHFGANFS